MRKFELLVLALVIMSGAPAVAQVAPPSAAPLVGPETITCIQNKSPKTCTPALIDAYVNSLLLSTANSWTAPQTFTEWSMGGATTQPFAVPGAAVLETVVANAGAYRDNIWTFENDTVAPVGSSNAGQCGNAALTFRDGVIHYERGALGYSNVTTGCSSDYLGGDYLYAGIGDIGPPGDTDVTSFAIHVDNATGVHYFPGASYFALNINAKTNFMDTQDHTGRNAFEWDNENEYFTMYGTDSQTSLQLHVTSSSYPASISAGNSAGNPIALRLNDNLGAGVFLGSLNNYAFEGLNTVSNAVNWATASGSPTGGPVTFGVSGTDSTIAMDLATKNYGVIEFGGNANNWLQAGSTPTGGSPTLAATGLDSVVSPTFSCKGSSCKLIMANAVTAPSLALGGATIGTNALAVTGTSYFSGLATFSNSLTNTGSTPIASPVGFDVDNDIYLYDSGSGTVTIRAGAGGSDSYLSFSGAGLLSVPLIKLNQATWADNQTCAAGQLAVDANYVYACTAANTVKRAALSTF